MTKRLYSEDPYLREFDAEVLQIEGNRVWLDQTCFYPESGGQVGDTGKLGGIAVTETQFDDKKDIVHILSDKPGFQVGDSVHGQIDWERRYKVMRVHAASHIMEYFLLQAYPGLKLVGSHLNEKHDKSTYEADERLELSEVERSANDFIAGNVPIETWVPDSKRPYFRHWKSGLIEMSCGGTHPRNTSEIGPIKIKRETGGQGREKVITSLAR